MSTQPSDAFLQEYAQDFAPTLPSLIDEFTTRIFRATCDIREWLIREVLFERRSMRGVVLWEEALPNGHHEFVVRADGVEVSPRWRNRRTRT